VYQALPPPYPSPLGTFTYSHGFESLAAALCKRKFYD